MLESRTVLSTWTVLNNSDHDPGSLRAAIASASNGDQIIFDPALNGETITLTTGELLVNQSLTITGPGSDQLTVSGNQASRVLEIPAHNTVSLSGLTISNGRVVHGGGGILNAGTLTLTSATVAENVTIGDDIDFGAGIYNSGTLTVQNSVLTGNYARGVPPGFVGFEAGFGGAIYNDNTLTVTNSTLSNNTASGGAGIFNDLGPIGGIPPHRLPSVATVRNSTIAGNWSYEAAGGIFTTGTQLTVSNSTIAGNTSSGADRSGGILVQEGAANLGNSIVAGNTAWSGPPDLVGRLTTSGYNLIGSSQGGSGFTDTDLLDVDPLLRPLQDNGGPTPTMALLPGSPALSAGDPAQLGVPDQRGVVRSGGVNIGAYQASASALLLTAPDTVTAGMPFDVIVQAVDPFGQPALGYTGTVTFSTSDPDPGVVLPADYLFTAADQGSHTFSAGFTLITPGEQTLTVSDQSAGFSTNLSVPVTP
jgi:hypothetical protein